MTGVIEEAWAKRAEALFDLKRYADAEQVARSGLAGDPTDASGQYWLIRALVAQKRPKEALPLLDEYLARRPDSEWGHRQRALALLEVGKPRLAVASARESLRLAPELGRAHYAAALCYLEAGVLDKAREHVTRARSLSPSDEHAVFVAAQVAERSKDYAEAEELYRQVLAMNPANAPAMNNLGRLLLRRGDSSGARELFEQAARTDPSLKVASSNVVVAARRQVELGGGNRSGKLGVRWLSWMVTARIAIGLVQGSLTQVVAFSLVLAALAGVNAWVSRRRSAGLSAVSRRLLADRSLAARLAPARLRRTLTAAAHSSAFWAALIAVAALVASVALSGGSTTDTLREVLAVAVVAAFWFPSLRLSAGRARRWFQRRAWWPATR